jgi:hypothetical protein
MGVRFAVYWPVQRDHSSASRSACRRVLAPRTLMQGYAPEERRDVGFVSPPVPVRLRSFETVGRQFERVNGFIRLPNVPDRIRRTTPQYSVPR